MRIMHSSIILGENAAYKHAGHQLDWAAYGETGPASLLAQRVSTAEAEHAHIVQGSAAPQRITQAGKIHMRCSRKLADP